MPDRTWRFERISLKDACLCKRFALQLAPVERVLWELRWPPCCRPSRGRGDCHTMGPRAIPVLSEHCGRRIPFILTTALAQPTRQDAPVYRGRKEHRVERTCSRSRSRVRIQPLDCGSPGLQHPEFWMRRGRDSTNSGSPSSQHLGSWTRRGLG